MLRDLIDQRVSDAEGRVLGKVVDVVFAPASPDASSTTLSDGAAEFAAGGYFALVLVELAQDSGKTAAPLVLKATELAWDAAGDAIVQPEPGSHPHMETP